MTIRHGFQFRSWVAVQVMALAALTLAGAASSASYLLDVESTPGATGDAFSANRRLSGMIPETPVGPVAISANFLLNTELVPDKYLPDDTTPPIITQAPAVIYTGHDRALIQWQTNEIADGFVEYGLTASYGSSQGHTEFLALHQVLLVGLAAGTTYNFRVSSMDPFRNGPTFSANGTFATQAAADVAPPVVSQPVVTLTSVSSAIIDFTTGEAATTDLRHGATAALGQSIADDVFGTTHTRTLSGLGAGTQYFYAVDATDPSGNTAVGATLDFSLPAEVAITTTALPAARRGQTYSAPVDTTGGLGAVTLALISGTLPPGISLDGGSGQFFGEPSQIGTFDFTLRATDSGTPASTADRTFSILVQEPAKKKDDSDCTAGAGAGAPLVLALLAALARRRRRN